jgi:Reverse transcriptase (RNA-dependent DNA polymerase).
MREWYKENPKNIRIGSLKNDISLNCLGFADDLALLANNIQESRKQVKSLQHLSQKIGLNISFEKTEIMLTHPPLANKITVGKHEIKIVNKFKYLGEIITYNLNEKPAWQNRIKKLNKANYITKNTYNKKGISIAAKLKHYLTVTQPEVTYAAETIFKTTNTAEIDRILKTERRIIRTCINKQYEINGHWRIASNETVYKEIEPILSTIRKKRISFFGHLIRAPANRISKKIIEKLWKSKSNIKWITEIKEDLKELQITVDDLKNKTDNTKKLNNKQTRLQTKINKRSTGRVITNEERKRISERMKKYWADRRAKISAYKNKFKANNIS